MRVGVQQFARTDCCAVQQAQGTDAFAFQQQKSSRHLLRLSFKVLPPPGVPSKLFSCGLPAVVTLGGVQRGCTACLLTKCRRHIHWTSVRGVASQVRVGSSLVRMSSHCGAAPLRLLQTTTNHCSNAGVHGRRTAAGKSTAASPAGLWAPAAARRLTGTHDGRHKTKPAGFEAAQRSLSSCCGGDMSGTPLMPPLQGTLICKRSRQHPWGTETPLDTGTCAPSAQPKRPTRRAACLRVQPYPAARWARPAASMAAAPEPGASSGGASSGSGGGGGGGTCIGDLPDALLSRLFEKIEYEDWCTVWPMP